MCKVSLEIEHKFNPLTGYQDSYGCGIGGLKRLDFFRDEVKIKDLNDKAFNQFKMYLVDTNGSRNSNDILSSINIKKSKKLLDLVENLEYGIMNKDDIYKILNDGWKKKKEISPFIVNDKISELDKIFSLDNSIKGVKLCGAGGGGYFLILSEKEINRQGYIKIEINKDGVSSMEI
jgi:galactokinase/mevalonate kinase-like predicted kinase